MPPPLARTATHAALAAILSLPIPSSLSADTPVPSHAPHPWSNDGSSSLVARKERGPSSRGEDSGEAGALPTLATLVNVHTGELLPLSETEPTPSRFSDFLEDRGLRSRVEMSPGLLEMLRAVVREKPGTRIEIVSGYRSPKRNEMMRKKGRNVASHSQHTLGMAVDFRVEGLSVGDLVRVIEELDWQGGLGRYDGRSDRFVHVDLGPRRRWRGR